MMEPRAVARDRLEKRFSPGAGRDSLRPCRTGLVGKDLSMGLVGRRTFARNIEGDVIENVQSESKALP